MDISAITSGASGSSGSALSGQSSPLASKKATDSLGLNKAINQGAIVSGLLPALSSSRSGSTGSAGLSADIYTAVGMQTQGMMSRGLMGIQIANISLGIDMSQAAKDAAAANEAEDADAIATPVAEAEDAAAEGTVVPAEPAPKPPVDEAAHAERLLDGMLNEEAPAPSRYYSSPELSNPALGGLLNSLG